MGGNDIYRRSMEPILVLLSDLYSDEEISVSVSGLFFCLTYTVLLATTIYYLNQIVCNFDLRRLFYSRQCFKSICYSSA